MPRRKTSLPTDAELRILRVLWTRGPSTVREVHEALKGESEEWGYTTVLKLMQIMTEKGAIQSDKSLRPQVFRTVEPAGRTQRRLVTHLLDRAFAGSPGSLVLQALSAKRATPEERRRIRELLDRLEESGE